MSTIVLVNKIGEGYFTEKRVVCKGAPEIVKTLLKDVKTISNFINFLSHLKSLIKFIKNFLQKDIEY